MFLVNKTKFIIIISYLTTDKTVLWQLLVWIVEYERTIFLFPT